jgi:hypothetical protein
MINSFHCTLLIKFESKILLYNYEYENVALHLLLTLINLEK